MKTNFLKTKHPTVTPDQNKKLRIGIFLILAALLVVGVTLPIRFFGTVEAQKAAKRTAISDTKSSRRKNLRRSQDAQVLSRSVTHPDGTITGGKIVTDAPIQETTAAIMADQATQPANKKIRMMREMEHEREDLPGAPGAIEANQWPLPDPNARKAKVPGGITREAPQTLGTQFDGATGPTETGSFPPDTMGAVGPTQVLIFINGRVRSFNKTTGVADGFLNADPDVFFASVMTPPLAGEVVYTTDPQVRFDRLSNRWFMVIIDAPVDAATGNPTRVNRILIAVNDAASNGSISGSTVWTFYQFTGDATLFTDYESLGIDANALYIGGDEFTIAGSFNSTKGWVIPKAPALTASPLTVWAFSGLVATPTGAGPWAPRGVDNYDTTNTGPTATGYFIGPDNATFNTLMLRRVTDPSNTAIAPTISANISVATPLTTRFPVLVPHLGNTGGTGGRLDSLDDRLYAAHLRNGRLWTVHNIGVNNTGVAGATNNRNAARWYELQNLGATPSVLQSGTLFDNNATNDANQRNYSIPSIMVSGQGHAALGCTIAGTNERINAFTTGRLTGDTLGALRDGPGGAALPGYTASASAYNPPGDPGGPSRRWGDYSYTSLDPKDDMTMWTVQEYCNGTNTYAPRAVKLIAPPPPPTNTSNPSAINLNNPSRNLVVTGTAPAGQGFYDPGTNPPAPHTPFTHIGASGVGIIVNSIAFNTPTQVTINVSTVGSTPGTKTITITNPDGQTTTVNVLIGPTAAPANVSGRVTDGSGSAVGGATIGLSGGSTRITITDASGNYHFDNLDTGNFYTVTPSLANYHFSPASRSFSLVGNMTDAGFTATADTSQSANAIDSAEYFVRQQYLDFLGREPDQGGFDYWTSQFTQCSGNAACILQKRIDVSAAFFMSGEFQETGSYVYDMYAGLLGRTPGYNEFTPDRAQVVGGSGLDAAKTAFAQNFVQRSEFTSRYPAGLTREQFVDAVLQTMQQRSGVDLSSQRAGLLADYDNGGRPIVARHAAELALFVSAEYNRAFVLMEYFGYLRRGEDTNGYAFWLNALNQGSGNNYRGMVCSFLTSTEYQHRFSSVVTHNNGECGQ